MTTAGPVTRLALAVSALALQAPLELAQAQRKSEQDYEAFEEVCPYTNGDAALERKLGYTRVGEIHWRGSEDSRTVQQNMGGIPMIFVETEHYRIGSSLTTYKLPNDREERARLKEELARLEAKLGRLKAPRGELDPWLRVHLYAQRAEDFYRQFHEDWGIEVGDYSAKGPHLGFPNKHLLLLCERKSEFGRYLKIYENSELEYTYRSGWFGEGMITCGNFESIAEHWKEEKDMPLDSMFTCMISASLAGNLVDGWNSNMFRTPTWITYGYAHIVQKRFDERWPVLDGRTTIYGKERDKTHWEPRVGNLVKHDFFARTEEMFTWTKYEDMNQRDHLVAWSKLTYLLTEATGDAEAFLTAVCPFPTNSAPIDPGTSKALQIAALEAHFALTPARLDEEWVKWVKRTYRKR